MKTIVKNIVSSSIVYLLFVNNFGYSQKNSERIISKYNIQLQDGYKYSGYLGREIIFNEKEKKETMEFTAFRGIAYKVIFCPSKPGVPVTINIYDKNPEDENRKKIFDNSENPNNAYWVFEPPNSRTYYIEYIIPANDKGKTKKINMAIIIGAKVKRDAEIAIYTAN